MKQFQNTPLCNLRSFNLIENPNKKAIDLVTIAFNNEEVIYHQHRLLKKYLIDSYCYTVIDNSIKPAKAKLIEDLCRVQKISYIKLPYNFSHGSDSHGFAINWAYANYVKKRNLDYFGFLDHDIYPIKSTSIIDKLTIQPFYGLKQERSHSIWYLWAGFCFFNQDYFKDKELDFSPCAIENVILDTGGSNYRKIYSNENAERFLFPEQCYKQLRKGNITQADMIEFIGDWVHSFNGSYWMDVPAKENDLNNFLNQF
jgi:hypothetical protein